MSGSPVLVAVASTTAEVSGVHDLVTGSGWQVTDGDLLAALRGMAQLRCAVEATYLAVVRELTDRGGNPTALVREATGASPGAARRDVAAAGAVGPDGALAGFGERLLAGRVNREHVDVAVRCLDAIPAHLTERPEDRAVITDALFAVVDAGSTARELARAARLIRARLDPDGQDKVDPCAAQRRFLDMHTDATGMLTGRFQLDAAAGAVLAAAINAHSAPAPERTGPNGDVTRDPRLPRQRRADALHTIAEMALGVTTQRRGERPRIVVHTTAAQLAGVGATTAVTESGDVVPAWAAHRLACDAVLQRMVLDPSLGPLDVGREHRLVTPAQRRALEARDAGCAICGDNPTWCDAHHVIPWSQGGASDLANYLLLCPRHHTSVHTGEWVIDTDPLNSIMLIPPRWVDPQQRPRPPLNGFVRGVVERLDDPGEHVT